MAPCEARRLDRRGSIQWCARVLRTTGDHEVVRCIGGDRTRNCRRFASNGTAQKASTNRCT
jgi:hypothetical protein